MTRRMREVIWKMNIPEVFHQDYMNNSYKPMLPKDICSIGKQTGDCVVSLKGHSTENKPVGR